MAESFQCILDELPRFRAAAAELREVLLANLVMFGEIPAPTFGETDRITFLQQRFCEHGLQDCSTDDVGNGFGVVAGQEGENTILVVAHADTVFPESVDHTITLQKKKAVGPGVADNAIGLAVLASLPDLLEHLGLQLQSNLLLMGDVRSLGRGNLEGIRFFLENNRLPIRAGVCLEGVQLGRVTHRSHGMLRAEIGCRVPGKYDWTRFGTANAVLTLNEVINGINEIALPRRPKSSIVIGSIEGGTSFNAIPTVARLRLEIRSESAAMVTSIQQELQTLVAELSAESGSLVTFETIARREPGGIHFRHPLVTRTRAILRALGVKDRLAPSFSELSAFADKGVAAVTLGLTRGEHLNEISETLQIEPLATGVAQLLATLLAIDGGHCDDN